MRLTLVTETFPPEVNGVARTLGRWVDAFRRRGHLAQVIRPRQPHERGSQERVFAVPLPFYREVRLGLATPGRVRRLLAEFRPDLVHVATEGPLGLAALWAARRMGVPLVSSFHTHYDEYLRHYAMSYLELAGRAYLRWFHNRTALTLVPGEATRDRLEGRGYHNLAVWPRGVDPLRFHPRHRDEGLRAGLGLGCADSLVAYVGRLAPEKNLGALLSAFGRLRGHGLRVRLALVGGGPLEERLRAACPPDVVMPGYQHGEALARWYASADVFAFPSLTETFGNVILEAQASALPVVGFRCPALAERVADGADGFLVGNVDGMAMALARLIADAGLRRRFGNAARIKAEGQDWEPIFDRLEARYGDVIARTEPGTDDLSRRLGRWHRAGPACVPTAD
jgi:glycosyltransferase involved in cell wall biosynthesis